jgi:hypothetical protein
MLQAPAEAMSKRMPDARNRTVNARTGIGTLKTFWWGLEGTTKIVSFVFSSMEGPFLC